VAFELCSVRARCDHGEDRFELQPCARDGRGSIAERRGEFVRCLIELLERRADIFGFVDPSGAQEIAPMLSPRVFRRDLALDNIGRSRTLTHVGGVARNLLRRCRQSRATAPEQIPILSGRLIAP
jgi:hypothetical protein